MDMEEIVFTLISGAGEAKSYCFEAVSYARKGDFEKASEMMKKSSNELIKSHNIQTSLLQKEAAGDRSEVTLLLLHAEDHLMNAMTIKDMAGEMIESYKLIYSLKEGKNE